MEQQKVEGLITASGIGDRDSTGKFKNFAFEVWSAPLSFSAAEVLEKFAAFGNDPFPDDLANVRYSDRGCVFRAYTKTDEAGSEKLLDTGPILGTEKDGRAMEDSAVLHALPDYLLYLQQNFPHAQEIRIEVLPFQSYIASTSCTMPDDLDLLRTMTLTPIKRSITDPEERPVKGANMAVQGSLIVKSFKPGYPRVVAFEPSGEVGPLHAMLKTSTGATLKLPFGLSNDRHRHPSPSLGAQLKSFESYASTPGRSEPKTSSDLIGPPSRRYPGG